MKLTSVDNPYTKQHKAEFGGLRFSDELEYVFRQWFRDHSYRRTRVAVLCGVLLFTIFAIKDYLTLDPAVYLITVSIRMLLIVPALGLIYLLVRNRGYGVVDLGISISGAIALYGLATAYFLTRQVPDAIPYEGLLLVTIYIYFMLGLRLWWAVAIALPMVVIFPVVAQAVGEPTPQWVLETLYIASANVIGIVGAYTLEYLSRENFLSTKAAEYFADHDPLTGLYNRKALLSHIETVWRAGLRDQHPVALFVVDVDFFKRFNDRYGHMEGDECLIRIARALLASLVRPLDLVGRYGGEEFVALAYAANLPEDATRLAERMLEAVRQLAIPHADSPAGCVTVSIGYAICGHGETFSKTLERADKALYVAKSAGRDCANLAEP